MLIWVRTQGTVSGLQCLIIESRHEENSSSEIPAMKNVVLNFRMQRSNFSFREKRFFPPNKQTTKCYVGLKYIKKDKKKFSCTAWKEKGEGFLVPWNNPKAGHKNQSSSEPSWEAVRPAPLQIPVTWKPGCRALRRCPSPRLRTQPTRYLPGNHALAISSLLTPSIPGESHSAPQFTLLHPCSHHHFHHRPCKYFWST